MGESWRSFREKCYVRPLKSGVFKFKVYFNSLTENELNTLLWTLEIGGKYTHGHKIGMGKSIGLGSIQIAVKNIKRRKLEIGTEKVEYSLNDYIKPDYSLVEKQLRTMTAAIDEFFKITDYDNAPANVSYPINDGENNTYSWFGANKRVGAGTGTSPVINRTLPKINDNDIELPTYKEI